MIHSNDMYYEFLYEFNSIESLIIVEYLKDISTSFIPKWLVSEENDFSEKTYSNILMSRKNEIIQIIGIDDSQFIIGSWTQNRLVPRRIGLMWRYHYLSKSLTPIEINFITAQPTFKIGFEENNLYHVLQSEDNPQYYRSDIGKEYTKKPLIKNFYDWDIIDISQNPGREHFLPGIKFIPAFRIWFGQEVQELFGRQKILDYPHAVYTKVLPNGVIEMQLMKDIQRCGSWRNQWKQRDIVKYFEIEKLEVPKY